MEDGIDAAEDLLGRAGFTVAGIDPGAELGRDILNALFAGERIVTVAEQVVHCFDAPRSFRRRIHI